MQMLLLGVDKKSRAENALAGLKIADHSPGMLGGMILSLSLVFLLYLAGWQSGPAWLNLHTLSFSLTALQTLLMFAVCWLAALMCSPAGHRHGRAASYQVTNEATRWMLLYPGALFGLLTLLLMIVETLRGHPWPAPLLTALLLLVFLRFWPQIFNLPWLFLYIRRSRPLARTILVGFVAPQTPPAPEAGDEDSPPDPNH